MLLCRCCSALLLPASAEPLLLLARVLENPPGDMAPARSCQRSRTGGLALVKEGAVGQASTPAAVAAPCLHREVLLWRLVEAPSPETLQKGRKSF
ncbi:hypothetical protein SEVIR_4G279350v4 [Setaria viridis]